MNHRFTIDYYLSRMKTALGRKKPRHFCRGLCSRYLSSRAVTRQVLSAYMSLTSVFGMAASLSAACGGSSEGAACAAVGEGRWRSIAEDIRRAPQTETGGPLHRSHQIRKPPHFCGGFVFALPIFTASRPATIVGVHVLNFCVRDGNRWTHMAINTNYVRWL